MAILLRLSSRLRPISATELCLKTSTINSLYRPTRKIFSKPEFLIRSPPFTLISTTRKRHYSFSTAIASWLMGSPEIVKAGDPVLHKPARKVGPEEIGSERIQKVIDDMIKVMRLATGVGLSAPQIGIPLRIIILEDAEFFLRYAPKEVIKEQDRRPFDLMVIVNPELKKKGNKTALFFEGCLCVKGFGAVVERYLEVVVTGFNRDGQPIKVEAKGWQARILQHECDHLNGSLYVDKMVPRTFRTVDNWGLPLAEGCPRLGVH